ncbi:hypothetical protein QA612_10285 [Evansella sp. AB-P1]|uniref:glucosamine inositolphosphorylceramide transferase family protein n=1 Tax=Evansella sp. AB-P1 TaxID=3037653 RepID=UPI00241C6504|nr:hypothetical protein [Evansella sp. AB-P1]MDG5787887.1 hypothetical protein [Evansella sp. AB-P1]
MQRKEPLSFGVILSNTKVESWKIECINNLLRLDNVHLRFILVIKKKEVRKKKASLKNVLFHYFESYSTKRMKCCKQVDVENHLTTKLTTITKFNIENTDGMSNKTLKYLNQYGVDFVLNLSDSRIERDIIQNSSARYGIWEFYFGDDQIQVGKPAYFWELFHHDCMCGVALHRLTEKIEEKIVLKNGFYSTIADSYVKNRDHIYSAITNWPSIICKEILYGGKSIQEKKIVKMYPDYLDEPSNSQTLKFLYLMYKNKMKKMFNKFFRYEYWNVGIVEKPINSFIEETEPTINWLVNRNNLFYADPFGYKDETGYKLFMEELDYKQVNGFITQAEVHLNSIESNVSFTSPVLKLPSHMSYPYIVEYKNNIYCIPETSEANEVSIYKVDKDRICLRKVKTLISGFPGVDSTVIKYNGFWWLFCTKGNSSIQSDNSELYIYYAKELLGDWKAHLLNPVKVDVKSSRPAGTPFISKGVIYRPAQDCSKTYGGRVVLNKITTLTTTQFNEETVSTISPRMDSLYPDGLHTISSVGNVTILDGKRFDYGFHHFIKKIYRLNKKRITRRVEMTLQTNDK